MSLENMEFKYITQDLAEKTKYKSIADACESKELSIVLEREKWYAENMKANLYRLVHKEMERIFPQYKYMFGA